MAYAVWLVTDAVPGTISLLHDDLIDKNATHVGRCSFDCRIYRENSPSPDGVEDGFLYTLKGTDGTCYCFTKETGTEVQGDIDVMLSTKLRALWAVRQSIKGEGHVYSLPLAETTLRIANVILQGNFRGLLVELETAMLSADQVTALINTYELPQATNILFASTKLELAQQYIITLKS